MAKAKQPIMIPRVKPREAIDGRWGDGMAGSIPHYAAAERVMFEWSPCAPFVIPGGCLEFQGMTRGRSAAYATLTIGRPADKWSGIRYGMFLTDLDDVLQNEGIVGGKWYPPGGVAIPVKRGQNFGIRRLTDEELKTWIKSNRDLADANVAITTEKRIEAIGEHAQELGRVDVLHEQQLDEIARILQIAERRAKAT